MRKCGLEEDLMNFRLSLSTVGHALRLMYNDDSHRFC